MKIKYFTTLSQIVGKEEEDIKGEFEDLMGIIDFLDNKYSHKIKNILVAKEEKLTEYYAIMIDGETARDVHAKVKKDSTIIILPVINGG